jgi:hypothetical protein
VIVLAFIAFLMFILLPQWTWETIVVVAAMSMVLIAVWMVSITITSI